MINIGKIVNIDIFFSFPPLQSLTHILNICNFMDIMFGCIFITVLEYAVYLKKFKNW